MIYLQMICRRFRRLLVGDHRNLQCVLEKTFRFFRFRYAAGRRHRFGSNYRQRDAKPLQHRFVRRMQAYCISTKAGRSGRKRRPAQHAHLVHCGAFHVTAKWHRPAKTYLVCTFPRSHSPPGTKTEQTRGGVFLKRCYYFSHVCRGGFSGGVPPDFPCGKSTERRGARDKTNRCSPISLGTLFVRFHKCSITLILSADSETRANISITTRTTLLDTWSWSTILYRAAVLI